MDSGPWLSLLALDLDLQVASKSNYRQGGPASWRRFRAFEDALTRLARSSLPVSWPDLGASLPLAERPPVALVIVASTMLDAANLPKSITDALEGVCYMNDASARAISVLSVRSRTPKVSISVAALDPLVSLDDLSMALRELQTLTVSRFMSTLGSATAISDATSIPAPD